MGGKIQGGSNSAIVYFDDVIFLWGGNGDAIYIGMNSSSDAHPTTYGIFVPKGTVITTRNSGTYNLEFYSIN